MIRERSHLGKWVETPTEEAGVNAAPLKGQAAAAGTGSQMAGNVVSPLGNARTPKTAQTNVQSGCAALRVWAASDWTRFRANGSSSESIKANNCSKFTSGCLAQHPLLSRVSSSLCHFFPTSNTSSIHQALHPSIIKRALHPSCRSSSEQTGWMASFCSLSAFLYWPIRPFSHLSRVCVCEFMLHEDQNKGFASEVGTFGLVVIVMNLFAAPGRKLVPLKTTHHLQKWRCGSWLLR